MAQVDELTKDAVILAQVANAVSDVIHKGVWASWEILQALLVAKSFDIPAFMAQVSGIADPAERKSVEASFLSALQLQDANVQAKVVQAVNVLEEAVSFVEGGIEQVMRIVSEVKYGLLKK